jgi:hypothetical protein
MKAKGRPKNLARREHRTKCKKAGCDKPPAKGQAYCDRAHAPFGFYDLHISILRLRTG